MLIDPSTRDGIPCRSDRWWKMMFALCLIFGFINSIAGCGGADSSSPPNAQQPSTSRPGVENDTASAAAGDEAKSAPSGQSASSNEQPNEISAATPLGDNADTQNGQTPAQPGGNSTAKAPIVSTNNKPTQAAVTQVQEFSKTSTAAPALNPVTDEAQLTKDALRAFVAARYKEFPRRAIPTSENAPTKQAQHEQWIKFFKDRYLNAYMKNSRRNPRWHDAAQKYVEQESEAAVSTSLVSYITRYKSGITVGSSGCDDPFVIYLYVLYTLESPLNNRWAQALPLMRQSWENFANSSYPAELRWPASMNYLWVLSNSGLSTAHSADQIFARGLAELKEAVATPPQGDIARRVFFQNLLRAFRAIAVTETPHQEKWWASLRDAVVTQPNVDPWLRDMTHAQYHRLIGWQAWKSGRRSNASPQDQTTFQKERSIGIEYLVRAWRREPQFPEAATLLTKMVEEIGGIAGESSRFWFDEAIAVELDCEDAYEEYRESLGPDWGGSYEAMIAFAAECVATKRCDIRIPSQCQLIFTYIERRMQNWKAAASIPGMLETFRDMVNVKLEYDRSIGENGRYSMLKTDLLCMAWGSGHNDEARAVMNELGDDVMTSLLGKYSTNLEEIQKDLDTFPAPEERRASEWVLNLGGKMELVVMDETVVVAKFAELPETKFTIKSIDMSNRPLVDDRGMKILNELTQLESLDLSGTKISDSAITQFLTIKTLRTLNVAGTNVSASGVRDLNAKLPMCKIER